MRSKAKFLPILVVLAFLISLVAIIPTFAVQGTVAILDTSNAALSYAKQGATIRLQVTDADLTTPLKRVLVAGADTGADLGQTITATAGSTAVTTSGDLTASLSVGDTFVVTAAGSKERVKKVSAITATTITTSTPFTSSLAGGTAIAKVTNTSASQANCPDCTIAAPSPAVTTNTTTNISLPDFGQLDSGVSTLANRFAGSQDSFINKNDVQIVDSSGALIAAVTINSLDAANGIINVTTVGTAIASTAKVLYWTAVAGNVGVSEKPVSTSRAYVKSSTDTSGIGVVLTETGPGTGVFRADIALSSTASDNTTTPPQLQVLTTDVVTLYYNDANGSLTSTSINIETSAPTFSNLSPTRKSATTAPFPSVSGSVADSGSGVKSSTIRVVFNVGAAGAKGVGGTVTTVDPNVSGNVSSATGGYSVTQQTPARTTNVSDADVLWWITANDNAGNSGVSDAVASFSLTGTIALTATSATVAGTGTLFNDELAVGSRITIDGQSKIVNAIASNTSLTADSAYTNTVSGVTGTASSCSASGWATSAQTQNTNAGCDPMIIYVDNIAPTLTSSTTGQWWDTTITGTNKTNTTASKAKANMVKVVFSETLDATSVIASDFNVGGVAPIGADVYSGAPTAVFLTLASNLAPDAKPTLSIVGEVKDVAGNSVTTGQATSVDGIAPTITVTVTGTASGTVPATNSKITVQFATNEAATVDNNSVKIQKVATTTTLDGTNISSITPTLVASNTWKVEVTAASDGVYNVYVTATDLATNQGTKGASADPSSTSAILFEKDTAVAAATATPANAASITDPNAFLILDFTPEGKEYGLDAGGAFTTTAASVVTDKDTHGKVTLTSATLDAVDILSAFNTADNIVYLYKSSNLALGDHTIKYKASDEAGNALAEQTITFTVKAKVKFDVKLQPGWNLISMPNSPSSPAINTVVTVSSVTTVITYDPAAQGGPWLTAVRGTDGSLTGSLTEITAGRAYWVQTSTFEPLSVDIPGIGGGQQTTPPTVAVSKGWNLVPALDVTGTKKSGDALGITAAQYLTNVKYSRIYTFDTITGVFSQVADTTALTVGKGYWVYATESGVIVP